VRESEYREIVEECVEFGWLNYYQDAEFRQIERETLLPALAELRGAQQVLASIFLQQEYLEPGVALAPSGQPLPELLADPPLPAAVVEAFDAAGASRGTMLLARSPEPGTRRTVASAAAALARERGFHLFRVLGRLLPDGRRDQVYEPLITEVLGALAETARAEFCAHRGQYLQLMAPLGFFPVRPGGVFNTDPGLNRTKLNKAFCDLLQLQVRLGTGPVCLLAEEAHLFPRLGLEALAYLAWIVTSGTMGISGLGEEDRTLDELPFLLVMTSESPPDAAQQAWTEQMSRRRARIVDIA
jgi:hypothetical protein